MTAHAFEIRRENVEPMSGSKHFECVGKNIGLPADYRHWPSILRTSIGDGKPFSMSRAIVRSQTPWHSARQDVLYIQMSTGVTLLVHA